MAPATAQTKIRPAVTLPPMLDRERFLNVDHLAEMYGFSVAHIRRLYTTGKLPKPVKIGGNKCGWRVGVILDFNAAQASRAEAA